MLISQGIRAIHPVKGHPLPTYICGLCGETSKTKSGEWVAIEFWKPQVIDNPMPMFHRGCVANDGELSPLLRKFKA